MPTAHWIFSSATVTSVRFSTRNLGDGTFSFATETAGLAREEHHDGEEHEHDSRISSVEHGAWADFDNDGDLDLYLSVAVASEHHHHLDEDGEEEGGEDEEHAETENLFFVNNGDGTFTDATEDSGIADPNHAVSHCAVWGDYNNDGLMDLFVCNLGSVNEGTAAPSRLFRNEGGAFTDVTAEAGIEDEVYAFSAAWVDFNNDGHLDLSVIYHPSHDDFPAGVLVDYPHPLYQSNGDGTFTNLNADAEQAIYVTGVLDISHLIGLAWLDADRDGDEDFAVTENHGDGPLRFYTNQTAAAGNNWLQIDLLSGGANARGIGSRITVTAGATAQIRDAGLSRCGWGSQSISAEHFGLGQAESADAQIRWPDGTAEIFRNLTVNQRHQLHKGQGEIITAVRTWMIFD